MSTMDWLMLAWAAGFLFYVLGGVDLARSEKFQAGMEAHPVIRDWSPASRAVLLVVTVLPIAAIWPLLLARKWWKRFTS